MRSKTWIENEKIVLMESAVPFQLVELPPKVIVRPTRIVCSIGHSKRLNYFQR